MSGLFDSIISTISDFGSQIFSGTGANSTGNYNWVLPMVTADLTATGVMNSDSNENYGNTEEDFNSQMTLSREQMAQQLEIAKMNAAASGQGSGAAVAAARIAAESQQKQMKTRVLADSLANQLQATSNAANLQLTSATNVGNALATGGQTSQAGLQNVAALIAGARR